VSRNDIGMGYADGRREFKVRGRSEESRGKRKKD
jgi:hypothetical protein